MKSKYIIESFAEFEFAIECSEDIYEGWLGSMLSAVSGALKKAITTFMKPYSDLYNAVKKDFGAIVNDANTKKKFINAIKQSYMSAIKEVSRAETPEEIQSALSKFKESITNTKETFGVNKINEADENTTDEAKQGASLITKVFDKISLGFTEAGKSMAQMILKKVNIEKMKTEVNKTLKEVFGEAMKLVNEIKTSSGKVDTSNLKQGTVVRYEYTPGRTTKVKIVDVDKDKGSAKVIDDEGNTFSIKLDEIKKISKDKKKDNKEKKEES
jgi:hypothetical protein